MIYNNISATTRQKSKVNSMEMLGAKLWNFIIYSFAIYILFWNLSSMFGANLDILEDLIVKEEINIVKEEIKKVPKFDPLFFF